MANVARYPKTVIDKFRSPKHARAVSEANAAGRAVSFECGSLVAVSLRIGGDAEIEEAGFKTSGCAYMIAAAESVCERINGRELRSLHLADGSIDIGTVPPERRQCIELVREAVASAFAEYRKSLISEYHGEAALICTCFGVTEDRIDAVLDDPAARDLASVAAACNAGSGCGSCRMLIQEMIDSRSAA